MKKIKEILLTIVLPAFIIIMLYAAYDYWTLTHKPVNNLPVLKASSLPSRVVGPIIPHDKLPRRKFVVFGGKEINEKEYTRVLILDMNGDGIETCGVNEIKKCRNWLPGNSFDFNNDGFKEITPLIGEDDAILLYRPQGNDEIPQNGADVIGTYLTGMRFDISSGSFSFLRELAGGRDYLDKDDELMKKIRLWTYGKRRNIPAPMSLTDFGVERISLVPHEQKEFDKAGNILGDYAEVTFADGRQSKLQEVWLLNNPMVLNLSKIKPTEKTAGIPDVEGHGAVPSLRDKIEKSQNQTLENLVRRYLQEPDYLKREALLLDIIYQWTGVYEADPMSRISEDGVNYIGDARKLMALEKFIGRPYSGTHSGLEETPNPHHASVSYVLDAFNRYVGFLRNKLDTGGVLKDWQESVKMQWNGGKKEWDIDLAGLKEKIKSYAAKNETYQTKLLLTSFYDNLSGQKKDDNFLLDGKTIRGIVNDIKGLGNISAEIDMADFGKMVVKGTLRNETLSGAEGVNNIFIAAGGDDRINGGSGDDIYIYGLHDGIDTIAESGGYDRIMFIADIVPEKVVVELKESDLLIKVNGEAWPSLLIKDYALGNDKQVEELVFADGRKSLLPEIYQALLVSRQPLPLTEQFLK